MASYTDHLPQFNEYVSQQPVEAMVKVGMMKQQQYDTNVQKISQSMSNIQGLNIGRDRDKNYLEKKISQLKNNLRTYAAGDFSSNQLTSSMTGMINGLAGDTVIQNSVKATQNAQKAMADQAKYTAAGKGSASRDWLLQEDLQKWYADEKDGASFNAIYKPYSDYMKKAIEVFKSVGEDSTTEDQPYGVLGRPITSDDFSFDENNKLVLNDAMVKKVFKGKSKEKLQQALMHAFTPDDWEQLQVDGRYHYSGMSDERFSQGLSEKRDGILNDLNTDKTALMNKIAKVSDINNKADLQKQLELVNSQITVTEKKFGDMLTSIQAGNAESVKAQLHTTEFLHGISNAFSTTSLSRTYVTNPLAEMAFKRSDAETKNRMTWEKHLWDKEKFGIDTYFKEEELRLKQSKEAREAGEAGFGGLPGSGIPMPINKDDVPDANLAAIQGSVKRNKERIRTKDREIFGDMPVEEIEEMSESYFNDPSDTNGIMAEWFEERRTLEINNFVDEIALNRIEEEAIARYGDPIKDGARQEDLVKEFSYMYPDGENFETFTGEELLNFRYNLRTLRKVTAQESFGEEMIGMTVKEPIIEYDDDLAYQILSDKEMILYNATKKLDDPRRDVNTPENYIAQTAERLYISNSMSIYDNYKARLEYKDNAAKNIITNSQGMGYGIELKGAELQTMLGGKLNVIADIMKTQGGGWPGTDIKVDDVLSVANNIKTAAMQVIGATPYYEAKYILTVTGADDKTVRIPLNREQKVGFFGQSFETSPELQALEQYEAQIIKTNLGEKTYGTTSIDGEDTNMSNTFLNGKRHFPNARVYGVSGNLVKSEGGNWNLRYNLFDPLSGEPYVTNAEYPPGKLIPSNRVIESLSLLSDDLIFQMLYRTKPSQTIRTREDLQREIDLLTEKANNNDRK